MQVLLIALGRMGERYRTVLERMFGESLSLTTVDPRVPDADYKDVREVPSDLRFELAIDARPNQNRLEMLQFLTERGVPHIILEKPSAASMVEAEAMQAYLQGLKHSPRVMVPFYRRFMEQFASQTLASLNAGQLKSLVFSCGAIGLGCNGVHLLDLANWLFGGPPRSVFAHLQSDTIPSPRGSQFKDHAGTLILKYPAGELVLHMLPDSATGVNMTFLYERGKIQVQDQRQPQWFWYRQAEDTWDQPYYRTHMEALVEPPLPYGIDLEALIRQGIEALLNQQPVPSLQDGYNTLKTIAMATRSHQERRVIDWSEDALIQDVTFQFT